MLQQIASAISRKSRVGIFAMDAFGVITDLFTVHYLEDLLEAVLDIRGRGIGPLGARPRAAGLDLRLNLDTSSSTTTITIGSDLDRYA